MNKNRCAGNLNLSETLACLLRILLYCSRPVTIAFVYARCCWVIPIAYRLLDPLGFSRKFACGERVAR
jgi:hypothetical protein